MRYDISKKEGEFLLKTSLSEGLDFARILYGDEVAAPVKLVVLK